MPAAGNTPGSSGVTGAGGAEFRRLLLATAISVFGSYAAAIALAVRTFEDTHQPAWVSAVFAAEFVPPVVIGVFFADRLNRLRPGRALICSDLVNAAVFALLAGIHVPVAVVALATVAGAATGVFRPISIGVVPAVVGEEHIDEANGRLFAVDTAMSAIGQAASGAIVAVAGAAVVLGGNAVSFALSAVLLSGCRSLAAVPATEGPRRTPLRRLRRSARTIRRAAPLRQVVVAWMPVLLALGIVNSIEVPLLLGPLAAGAAVTGITIAAASAGQTLGSLIAPRLGERLGRRYPLVLGMIGATVVASGASPVVALVILLFIAGGIANGLAIVHNRSVVQRSAEADERAGLLALLMAAGGVMTAAGAAAGGAIASASTPRAAFVAAGAVGLAAAGAAWAVGGSERGSKLVTLRPRAGRIRR